MQQFLDFMGTFRHGRRFLRLEEERGLLHSATARFNLSLEDARSALLVGARQLGLVLESDVTEETTSFLAARLRPNNRIARADFRATSEFFSARTGNMVSIPEAERSVRQMVMREGWRPAPSGWLWRTESWFNAIADPSPANPGPIIDPVLSGSGYSRDRATATRVLGDVPIGDAATVLEAWRAALIARNLPGILALYAPDGLLMATAENRPLIGPDQIRAYFQRLMSYEGLSVMFQEELQRLPSQPTAVLSGLYTFTWQDPQSNRPVVTPARYTFGVRSGTPGGNGRIILHHSSRIPGVYPGADVV